MFRELCFTAWVQSFLSCDAFYLAIELTQPSHWLSRSPSTPASLFFSEPCRRRPQSAFLRFTGALAPPLMAVPECLHPLPHTRVLIAPALPAAVLRCQTPDLLLSAQTRNSVSTPDFSHAFLFLRRVSAQTTGGNWNVVRSGVVVYVFTVFFFVFFLYFEGGLSRGFRQILMLDYFAESTRLVGPPCFGCALRCVPRVLPKF